MFVSKNEKRKYLREFLLGSADAAGVETVENAILDGEINEEDLEIAEHSLIEEYLDEDLLPPDKHLFETRFLASPGHRDVLAATVALRRVAKSFDGYEFSDEEAVPASDGLRTGFAGFFSSRRALVIAFTAVLVSVVAIGVWFAFRDGRSSEIVMLEKRYDEINRSDLADLSKIEPGSIVTVFPTRLRGSDRLTEIELPASADILLRLSIPRYSTPQFRLKIEQANRETFVLGSLIARDDELRVIVPRSIFSSGAVRIIAEPLNGETPVIYDFLAR